tara:strand:- start:2182 stop:3333 length:1152 start_codon:yes stop_codon:yes gene_type:complete
MTVKQKRKLHRDWVDKDAFKIVRDLQKAGHTAYLVGGCVRDLLVDHPPKDFDIATDALPVDVKKSIRNAYIIGKRFRLVLVYRYKKVFEVATFRRSPTKEEVEDEDVRSLDNFFGSPEEDANRRDFTVNAIYYDCVNDDVIDYVDGLKDIDARLIRMIGDPDERFIEDPIRILRAIRLSHKLKFQMEENLRASIQRNARELQNAALPRIREDFLKILKLPQAFEALTEAYDLGVLQVVMPNLAKLWEMPEQLDLFHYYLKQKPRVILPEAEPAELMAFISYAYLKAVGEERRFSSIMKDFKDCHHSDFFKNELFVFNAEASWIRKLFLMMERIEKASFTKMKEKSRRHYASQRHLFEALKYLQLDYSISPLEAKAWLTYATSD